MKIFVNQSLEKGGKIELQNGATRRTLMVVNKTGADIEANIAFEGAIGTLNKGNHSFIFLNTPNKKSRDDERTMFVLADAGYGIDVYYSADHPDDTPVKFLETSVGGYGNSCSTIAVIEGEQIIEYFSYKHRTSSAYEKTDSEKGFIPIKIEDVVISGIIGDKLQEV